MKSVAILLSILICVAQGVFAPSLSPARAQEANKPRTSVTAQSVAIDDRTKKIGWKIERGSRLSLRNRFGPITVTGSDRDTLEAVATYDKGTSKAFDIHVVANPQTPEKILLAVGITARAVTNSATAENKENKQSAAQSSEGQPPPQPTQPPQPQQPQQPPQPSRSQTATRPEGGGRGGQRQRRIPRSRSTRPSLADSLRGVGEIRLEVKLPRSAHIELIDARRYAILRGGADPNYLTNTRNDVTVTDVDTPVSIIASGNVRAARVGAVEVRTRAGSAEIQDVAGPVSVTTITGAITIREAGSDVRAVSISGPVSIECARGRIETSTTNGLITLTGVGGDLDAASTGGEISFTGAIRAGGRYRLRSMSGGVRMMIQPDAPGFVVSMSSYQGQTVTDFPLKMELSANAATSDLPVTTEQSARRVVGRYGEGDARITLDSFSGTVQLGKGRTEAWKKCR